MVRKDEYVVQLVSATTHQPFLEHKDPKATMASQPKAASATSTNIETSADTYVEVEPNIEYFIRVQNLSRTQKSFYFNVDGESLGFCKTLKPFQVADVGLWNKQTNPIAKASRQQIGSNARNSISTFTALKFVPAGAKNAASASNVQQRSASAFKNTTTTNSGQNLLSLLSDEAEKRTKAMTPGGSSTCPLTSTIVVSVREGYCGLPTSTFQNRFGGTLGTTSSSSPSVPAAATSKGIQTLSGQTTMMSTGKKIAYFDFSKESDNEDEDDDEEYDDGSKQITYHSKNTKPTATKDVHDDDLKEKADWIHRYLNSKGGGAHARIGSDIFQKQNARWILELLQKDREAKQAAATITEAAQPPCYSRLGNLLAPRRPMPMSKAYHKGEHVATITLKCCTALGLIAVGVLPKPPLGSSPWDLQRLMHPSDKKRSRSDDGDNTDTRKLMPEPKKVKLLDPQSNEVLKEYEMFDLTLDSDNDEEMQDSNNDKKGQSQKQNICESGETKDKAKASPSSSTPVATERPLTTQENSVPGTSASSNTFSPFQLP